MGERRALGKSGLALGLEKPGETSQVRSGGPIGGKYHTKLAPWICPDGPHFLLFFKKELVFLYNPRRIVFTVKRPQISKISNYGKKIFFVRTSMLIWDYENMINLLTSLHMPPPSSSQVAPATCIKVPGCSPQSMSLSELQTHAWSWPLLSSWGG